MPQDHYLVPEQHKGLEKNIVHSVEADMTEEAEDWFVEAKKRLLNVNRWQHYGSDINAEFRLTDSHGSAVNRLARKGDYIRIDIPGPGSNAGGGFDWVVIEAVEYDDYPDTDTETFAMRVRPSANPLNNKEHDTAHFFSSDATSTCSIQRHGKKLEAVYNGRNETANTNAGIIDTVRNTTVAIGAWLGMSDVQWSGLMTGLLEASE